MRQFKGPERLTSMVRESGLSDGEIAEKFHVPVDWQNSKKSRARVFNELIVMFGLTGLRFEHCSGKREGATKEGTHPTRRQIKRKKF